MTRYLLSTLAVISLSLLMSSANAEVLTFESPNIDICFDWGFSPDGWTVEGRTASVSDASACQVTHPGLNTDGAYEGEQMMINLNSLTGTLIRDAGAFDLTGVYAHADDRSGPTLVNFAGLDNSGATIFTVAVEVGIDWQWVQFNWPNISRFTWDPVSPNSTSNISIDNLTFNEDAPPDATYSVGGTVSGLTGTGLELQNAGLDPLAISDNGSFTFLTELTLGTSYVVAVSNQPTGQTCTVSNGSGTISDQDVTDVAVNCVDDPAPLYTINGVISGLGPISVTLLNNNTDALDVSSNGPFVFATALPDGSAYDVTVSVQPADQTCTVTNGFGTVSDTDVLGVDVACVDDVVPPIDPPAPAVPVPTLSQWALIMLSMLLGLMVFSNRKRLF